VQKEEKKYYLFKLCALVYAALIQFLMISSIHSSFMVWMAASVVHPLEVTFALSWLADWTD